MVCAAALLAACGEESLTAEPQDNALRLQSVSMAEDGDARNTRASLGATAITKIGVYVTDNGHTALAENAQSTFELKSGTWSCTAPPKITVENTATPDFVYGFYPATGTVTNSSTGNHTIPVQVAADNFSASLQTDYLYAEPQPVHAGKRSVSFEMQHALAKVSFSILKSRFVTEKLTLNKVEIVSSTNRLQQGNNGTMNIGTGQLAGLADTRSLTLTGSTELKELLEQPNVSSLVAPMRGKETKLSFRLSVRVEGEAEDRVFETAAVPGDGVQWLAGHHYVYKMTVDKMGGSLTGIKIEGWKNDANQNTGIGI